MLKVIVIDSLSDDLPKFVDTTRNEFDYGVLCVTYGVCINLFIYQAKLSLAW